MDFSLLDLIWTRTPATPGSSNCSIPMAPLALAAESGNAWAPIAAIALPLSACETIAQSANRPSGEGWHPNGFVIKCQSGQPHRHLADQEWPVGRARISARTHPERCNRVQSFPAQPVVAVGFGDFDHKGVTDIMWRDTANGHLDNWMLAIARSKWLPNVENERRLRARV